MRRNVTAEELRGKTLTVRRDNSEWEPETSLGIKFSQSLGKGIMGDKPSHYIGIWQDLRGKKVTIKGVFTERVVDAEYEGVRFPMDINNFDY